MKRPFIFTAFFVCAVNSWASISSESDSEVFESAITENLKKVEEFEFAKEVAQKIGVRVYLFGGTASSFGHYVREFLSSSLEKRDFYDFDYTSIYRSTQDADLVIDGSAEQAKRFEYEMMSQFDHLQGSKSVWEVRTLRETRDDKGALLDDFDFLNQHTDSNSVGLIEITDPPKAESRIRDIHYWSEPTNPFLESIRDGSIQFYFSETHEKTSRFQSRQNPPIFSVIRFLTKAFQHDLEISNKDFESIKRIVTAFDPSTDLQHSYAQAWIEKNSKKLFINSRNVERSWNLLEEIGLRKKLIHLSPEAPVDSAAWWLNKEPLRSFELGQGQGKTAEELGIHLIAHETRGQSSDDAAAAFRAYESITASPSLSANVFISRSDKQAETAVYGDGFYTRIGDQGVGSSGYTIRFELAPQAREGSDFVVQDFFVIIKNKNAIRILPERMTKSPMDYLESLSELEIRSTDRALIHQFSRRVLSKAKSLEKEELNKIFDFIIKLIRADQLPAESITWALQILRKAAGDSFEKLLKEIHHSALQSHQHWRVLSIGDSFAKFFMKEESFDYFGYLTGIFIHLLQLENSAFLPGSEIIRALRYQSNNNPQFRFSTDEVEILNAFIHKNIRRKRFWLATTPILLLMRQNESQTLNEIFEFIRKQNFQEKSLVDLQEAFLYGVFSHDESLSFSEKLIQFVPDSKSFMNRFYFDHGVLPLHIEAHASDIVPLIKNFVLIQQAPETSPIDSKAASIFRETIRDKAMQVPKSLMNLLEWLSRKSLNQKDSLKISNQKQEALRRLDEISNENSLLSSKINLLRHHCRRILKGLN